MRLGRTGGAADTVSAGAAAQENHDVARSGTLPPHVCLRRGGDDCADLHTFGCVARVIKLLHKPGRQPDLIAIGGVARSGRGDKLALRKLAGNGLGNRCSGIRRAGDAHRPVNVCPA